MKSRAYIWLIIFLALVLVSPYILFVYLLFV